VFLCEPITAQQAMSWGMINQVVPRAQLDEAVEVMAGKLADKFPESLRYAKVQMNTWKEQAWASTVPHAGEWLALHSGSPEAYEGMRSFLQKRPPDHWGLREQAVADMSPEFPAGPPIARCTECGTDHLPAGHHFCGNCGSTLPATDWRATP
jgi:hypothetical protein